MLKTLTLICFGCFFISQAGFGQGIRQKRISTKPDTVRLDTLSLVPGSVSVKTVSGESLLPASYQVLYDKALLVWKQELPFAEADISYKTFPILLSKRYFSKDPKLIGETTIDNSAYVYKVRKEENTLFSLAGLNKSGSISRSIGFGNNQDLGVNSNMVLQLSGKLSSDIEILAAISDDNIPIQPGGNTQQLNDFDKVFIQLKRKNTSLIAGDYELRRPDSYFMNFFKRTQGGSFSNSYTTPKGWQYKSNISAAVAKGRSARNVLQGTEGNQGPYRLTGNNAEQFIVILSGTERVYLDGQPLVRGQENDYVIDYNTSELTFTPRRLITQNSRIIVEFEYSDKNYARSLTYLDQEISNKKLAFKFNFYNEQDNPNRPFLQTLSEPQKQYLQTIGNNTSQAFFSNADSVGFNSNEVLYKKADTLGAVGVYIHSTDPQLAKYRLGFSFVGAGQGNYRLNTASGANGRVFEFVAPVGGIKQGSYEPISLLVTPKKQQLVTLGADYNLAKNTFFSTELALSNNDANLFSGIGNAFNQGSAYKLFVRNEHGLGKDSSSLKLTSSANIEFTSLNFKAIERYRAVEFERDFNLLGLTAAAPERLGKLAIGLYKDVTRQVNYQLSSFVRQGVYNGLQHSLDGSMQAGRYKFAYAGNLLHSSSAINTGDFSRQRADVGRMFKAWQIGLGLEQEHNRLRNGQNGLLMLSSFSFSQYKIRIGSNADRADRLHLEYSRRYDKLPVADMLLPSSVADVVDAGLQLMKNPNSVLTVSSTYRYVNYNSRIAAKDESTLLGRTEYALKLWKGFVNSTTFYELGTGQEPKREFTYLEVQAGQGAYAWNDYNNNGIKELNEFEIARYQDQARYIRIFQPGNQFIKTNYTSVNQTLRLLPASLFNGKPGAGKFISRLSAQAELKIDRKVLDQAGPGAFNPFDTKIDAADLVSLNSYFRNMLFFNRNSPLFGIDINYQENGSKILLTNGFDTRGRSTGGIRLRWNLVQKTNLTIQANKGNKRYGSELFRQQDYHIRFSEFSPQLDYLFNTNFRLTFAGSYVDQKNLQGFGGEKAVNLRLSTEARYNILKKGVLTSRVNMIRNEYKGAVNSPVAYEMLDGLQPGNNLVWDAGLQRSIANGIQMNINYQGRKSVGVRTIHTGGVQVRAFF